MNGLGLYPYPQKSVNIPTRDLLHPTRTLSIQIEEQMQRRDSEQEERMERPRRRQDPGLRPLLVRRHILMISLSGTIGMGILITSGQVIKLAGSAGAFLSYLITGFIVHCVVSSLGEMVSLIPEAGAIMEMPNRFLDEAFGWTVAIMYWFVYAMGVTTLVTSTAIMVNGWGTDVGQGWIITAILAVVIAINVFGIRVFGEIEYICGFLKVLLMIGLSILMLAINRGVGPHGKSHGIDYWRAAYRFPPRFGPGATSVDHSDHLISGGFGQLLGVWKGMTLAAFSWVGVEIVAVTANEAKFPRDDLPRATVRIFGTSFAVYLSSIFFVSLVVPFTDPGLLDLYDPRQTTSDFSPFIIAIRNAGIEFLPGFISATIFFATWSTINTSLFVASRTIYGMAVKVDPIRYPRLAILSQTTQKGVPLMAIFASCIFSPLAYLQCAGTNPQKLLIIFSQVETVLCLIVWAIICLAFIRFYNGLQIESAPHDRRSKDYPYCSWGQPAAAYIGLIGCTLLIIFNGFDVFIFQPFREKDFLAAYLAVFVFVVIYAMAKFLSGRPMVTKERMSYVVQRENFDLRRPPNNHRAVWRFFSWIFG
ncbi:amino acid permease/ SLC12A domain-containing protein [Pyronema omphalodes]|nr:amino acid permease/ SLC12A domain-containing protein [Pyronema omphalodes]